MSATNTTTHYNLPSFVGSDKPAWLVDWNGAMAAIDSAIYEAKSTADQAVTAAGAVASDLATLAGTVSTQGSSITTLSETLTTAVGNINTINGNINTINSLIGNGTPTTTDKTIIGAINEINDDLGTVKTTLPTKQDAENAVISTNVLVSTAANNWYDLEANGFDITKPIFGFINAASLAFDFCVIPFAGQHIANGYSVDSTYGGSASLYFEVDSVTGHMKIKTFQVYVNGADELANSVLYLYKQAD